VLPSRTQLKWAPSPQSPKLSETAAGIGATDGTGPAEGNGDDAERAAAGADIETGIGAGGTGNAPDCLASVGFDAEGGATNALAVVKGTRASALAICIAAIAFGLISAQ
jgi:hypothetical protein